MSLSYYIYYRIDPQRAERARDAISHLMSAMEHSCGARVRLLRKRDEPHLWMEIYEDVSDGPGFERGLAHAVAEHRVETFLASGNTRRTECFESW